MSNMFALLGALGTRLDEAGVIPQNPEVSISAEVSATVDGSNITPEEEVTVAEAVTQAEEIASTQEEIESMTEAADAAETQAEMLASVKNNIKKYGLTPQAYDLLQHNGVLTAITLAKKTRTGWVAVESLASSNRNPVQASAIISGIEALEGNYRENIKKFFANLWEKIKALFNKIMGFIMTNESRMKARHEEISKLSGDLSKVPYNESMLTLDDMKVVSDAVGKLNTQLKLAVDEYPTLLRKIKDKITKNPSGDKTLDDGFAKSKVETLTNSEEFKAMDREFGGAKTLGEAGFTVDTLKGSSYTYATACITANKDVKKYIPKIESIVKAIKSDVLESGPTDDKEAADKFRKDTRKTYSDMMSVLHKMMTKNMQCARSYMYAATSAVRVLSKETATAK